MPDPFEVILDSTADGVITMAVPTLTKWLITGYVSLTVAFGGWLFSDRMQNREDMAALHKDTAVIMTTTNNTDRRLDRQEERMDKIETKLDGKVDKK